MNATLSAGQKNLNGEVQGFIISDKKRTNKPRQYPQDSKKKTGLAKYQEG